MSDPRFLVVVDTTALHRDWTMTGVRWEQVWTLTKRDFIALAVPRVVIMEAARQLIEHTNATHQKVYQQGVELLRQQRRLFDVGIPLAFQHLVASEPAPEELSRDAVTSAIERRIVDMEGEVLPLPQVSHLAVVDRDLDRRKPFLPNGKGYRDALAWESIRERVSQCPEGQRVIFVTANSDDYMVKAGMLATQLRDELPSHVGPDFLVLPDLKSLLELDGMQSLLTAVHDSQADALAESPLPNLVWAPEGMQNDVSAAAVLAQLATRLAGSRVSSHRQDDPGWLDFVNVEFPDDYWEVEIDDVVPYEKTAKWRVYDVSIDATLSIEAELMADIGFEGHMSAGVFYHSNRPDLVEIETYPEDEVVRAAYGNTVWLHFRAIADSSTMKVTALEFDRAEQVTDSELGEWHPVLFPMLDGTS